MNLNDFLDGLNCLIPTKSLRIGQGSGLKFLKLSHVSRTLLALSYLFLSFPYQPLYFGLFLQLVYVSLNAVLCLLVRLINTFYVLRADSPEAIYEGAYVLTGSLCAILYTLKAISYVVLEILNRISLCLSGRTVTKERLNLKVAWGYTIFNCTKQFFVLLSFFSGFLIYVIEPFPFKTFGRLNELACVFIDLIFCEPKFFKFLCILTCQCSTLTIVLIINIGTHIVLIKLVFGMTMSLFPYVSDIALKQAFKAFFKVFTLFLLRYDIP